MTVESVYVLRGRKLLLPGVVHDRPHRLLGEQVRVVLPDGGEFLARIGGVEVCGVRPHAITFAPPDSDREVPVGSEVWTA